MDSDGTLAKVTYLPGVVPPLEHTQERGTTPRADAVLSESTVLPEIAALPEIAVFPERSGPLESMAPPEGSAHVSSAPESPARESPAHESPAHEERAAPTARVLRRAENISLNALTRKGRSRWELGQILLARELDPSVVEAELDRLEGVGLIGDEALAENIVRTQHERKGLGRAALVSEMRRKHIDPWVIDAALESLGVDEEFTRALQLAERRANQLMGLDHNTAVRRLSGYLQRKGYSSDTVRRAVLEALPRSSSGVRFS